MDEDGTVQIDLEPDDEQITINIGPAEVLCFGGTIADPGTGPLVQVVLTDPAAQAAVEYFPSYLEVQFSPLEEGQSG